MDVQLNVSEEAIKHIQHRKDIKGAIKMIGDLIGEVGHGVEKNYLTASFENLTKAHEHISQRLLNEIRKATEVQL
ncbi:MAG: hypothetical protein IM559_15680 [Pseudanabaena sp. M151S2SP2A07QC]|jgi:hypothetical protein|nr:hypothetical protein [Pseudanabaena sp. M151S2SP2A07QC]